jgi:hypothetical protein
MGARFKMATTKTVYVCSDKFGVLNIFSTKQSAQAYVNWYEKQWPTSVIFLFSMPILKKNPKSLTIR